MAVAIVTDSTAYLTAEQVASASAALSIVPLHVVVGGVTHREGVDISVDDLVAALSRFTPVSTSRPSPGDFLTAYAAAAAAGAAEIVSVHISEDLSATVQGARLAAQDAPIPVHVVDSRCLAGALGQAALAAAQAAAAGLSGEQVAEVARQRADRSRVVFYVSTLEHLRRGGRIGAAAALLGSALAIKPILGLRDGRIVPLDKVRTAGRALTRMSDLACEAAGDDHVDVVVQHLGLEREADEVARHLQGRLGARADISTGPLGAVVGAHVGPGALGISVCPRVALP